MNKNMKWYTFQYVYFFLLSMGLTVGELSREVIPNHYDLKLTIDSMQRTLQGRVCIEIFCETGVTEIKLHHKEKHGIKITAENIIIKEKVGGINGEIKLNFEMKYENDEILTLKVPELKEKHGYELCIPYSGVINEENGYIIWEDNKVQKPKYIIATNFPKQGAFPCFDEPFLRSTFEIGIRVTREETVFSNTPVWHRNDRDKDKLIFIYKYEKKFAPSQISFVVTNKVSEEELKSYEYSFSFFQWKPTFWYRSDFEKKLNWDERFYNGGVSKSLGYMGPWFSYPSVTIMVIPSYRRILSFKWGLCIISEETIINTIFEEMVYNIFMGLSSQWIGGMVSPDSWDSNWMFTALASYLAYLEMGQDPIMKDVPIISFQEQPFNLDYTLKKSIDPFLNKAVGYTKGLMLLRMVHHALGQSAFVGAIDDFIKKYQFSSVGLEKLYEAFDGRSSEWLKGSVLPKGVTWKNVMNTWNKKGYPIVSVQREGPKAYKISQESMLETFRESAVPTRSVGENCWDFPITYATYKNPNFKANRASPSHWLGCGNREIQIDTKKDGWIIVNLNYIGLYRVKYDEYTVHLLVDSLSQNIDNIPKRIRAQLVMDSLAIAWLGKQNYQLTFNLLQFLKKETDQIVWRVFFIGANNLIEILENTKLFNDFKVFLTSFVTPAFNLYYKIKQTHDGEEVGEAEALIPTISGLDVKFHYWACILARSPKCRNKMLKQYEDWVKDTKFIKDTVGELPKNEKAFQSLAVCIALTYKSEPPSRLKRLTFIINTLLNGEETSEVRGILIDAIGCVDHETSLNRLLEWSTTSKYEKSTIEEKRKGFLELIKGEYTFLPTLNYFFENIGPIQSFYQSVDTLALFVYNLTSRIKKEDQLKKMEEFVKNTPELKEEKVFNEFQRGENLSKLKIEWLKTNEQQIKDALKVFKINSQNS